MEVAESSGSRSNDAKRKRKGNGASGRATRRALSCTECKRRKRRCSSLGRAPCDSCISAGHPEKCYWETDGDGDRTRLPATLQTPISTLPPDLRTMQDQISHLQHTLAAVVKQIDSLLPKPKTSSVSGNIDRSPNLESAFDEIDDFVTGPTLDVRDRAPGVSRANTYQGGRISIADNNREFSFLPDRLHPTRRKDAVLSMIRGILPSLETGNALVDAYFDGPFSSGWPVLDRIAFLKNQHIHSSSLHSIARNIDIDLTWLSLYLMVMALATLFASASEQQAWFPLATPSDSSALPKALYMASVDVFDVSRSASGPSISHIELRLLYFVFLFHFGVCSQDRNEGRLQLDSAVTLYHLLGLDLELQKNSISSNPEPLLFQKALEETQVDKITRLRSILLFLEGSTRQRRQPIRMSPDTVADVTKNRIFPTTTLSEFDCKTFIPEIGVKFALILQRHSILLEAGAVDQPTFWAMDADLEQLLSGFPALDGIDDGQWSAQSGMWMVITLYCSILNRRLRIHRPNLTEIGRSSKECVNSAIQLIVAQQAMKSYPHLRPAFVKRWILNSALVLAIAYITGSRHKPSPAQMMEYIKQARGIFTQPQPLDRTPDLSKACTRSMDGVLSTLHSHDVRSPGHSIGSPSHTDVTNFLSQVRASLEELHQPDGDISRVWLSHGENPLELDLPSESPFDYASNEFDLSWLLQQE